MSYFSQISVTTADSPAIDAFGRWRTSDLYTIFDSKNLYDTGSLVWATKTTGNATASFMASQSCVLMYASGSNSSVIRQSRKRCTYQPGKSQEVLITANFSGSSPNVIKKVGYYDNTDGICFALSGSSFGTCLRSSTSGVVVDTFTSQSNWNMDKYDGTGASGNSIDITKSQIFFMDFEWLGVGRVRYGIVQGGILTYVHQITNINALSTVYMASPNEPVRYELINSGSGVANMVQICSCVASEGGIDKNGPVRTVVFPNALTLAAGSTYGLIAIRQKDSAHDTTILPIDVSSCQSTATNIVYETSLLLNPSGSLPWVWQDVPNSSVQYATASANTYTVAREGTKIYSTVQAGQSANPPIATDPTFALGSDVDGVQDILVVGWRSISGNSSNACATLTWREL